MFHTRHTGFSLHGHPRTKRRWPAWLGWLLFGGLLGAGAVLYAQHRVLPPRLSTAVSTRIMGDLHLAEAERDRLRAELARAQQQLVAAQQGQQQASDSLANSRSQAESLQREFDAVVAMLPPDPRGGVVQVRAARFAIDARELQYEVVLTRDAPNAQPMNALMQLSVTGAVGRQSEATAALEPVALTLGARGLVQGRLALPAGFRPRQAMVQILDRPAGTVLGMRQLYVR